MRRWHENNTLRRGPASRESSRAKPNTPTKYNKRRRDRATNDHTRADSVGGSFSSQHLHTAVHRFIIHAQVHRLFALPFFSQQQYLNTWRVYRSIHLNRAEHDERTYPQGRRGHPVLPDVARAGFGREDDRNGKLGNRNVAEAGSLLFMKGVVGGGGCVRRQRFEFAVLTCFMYPGVPTAAR